MNIVALLESMWGWRGYSEAGDVIRYFRINPDNFSFTVNSLGSLKFMILTSNSRTTR